MMSKQSVFRDLNEAVRWFQEARFGLFVHWDLYASAAGEWCGQHHRERPEMPRGRLYAI